MKKLRLISAALVLALVLTAAVSLAQAAQPQEKAETQETPRGIQALDAFMVAGFSVEFGDQGRDFMLRWQKPIKLSLSGDYTPEDEAFLDAFLQTIHEKGEEYGLIAFPGIERVADDRSANMRVIYCPLDEMENHLTYYEPDNWGLFEYYYDNYRMTRATVVVSSDVTNQQQRNHLLMEEIVGSLGLTNDIDEHEDSIVYQPWTETQELSDLDWLMLSYLYSDQLKPGITSDRAYELLLPVASEL